MLVNKKCAAKPHIILNTKIEGRAFFSFGANILFVGMKTISVWPPEGGFVPLEACDKIPQCEEIYKAKMHPTKKLLMIAALRGCFTIELEQKIDNNLKVNLLVDSKTYDMCVSSCGRYIAVSGDMVIVFIDSKTMKKFWSWDIIKNDSVRTLRASANFCYFRSHMNGWGAISLVKSPALGGIESTTTNYRLEDFSFFHLCDSVKVGNTRMVLGIDFYVSGATKIADMRDRSKFHKDILS